MKLFPSLCKKTLCLTPVCSVVHPLDWLTRELSSYIKPHVFISCGQFIEVFLMPCFRGCCRPLSTPTSCVHTMNWMTLSWYRLVLCSGPRVDCCMWPKFKKRRGLSHTEIVKINLKQAFIVFSAFLKLVYNSNFIYLFKAGSFFIFFISTSKVLYCYFISKEGFTCQWIFSSLHKCPILFFAGGAKHMLSSLYCRLV